MQMGRDKSRAFNGGFLVRAALMALVTVALVIGLTYSRAVAQNASSSMTSNNADYRLGSGDRVRVNVFGEPSLSGDYQVDGLGKLAFPLVGQVTAGGLTASELQARLVSALSPDYVKNPSVSIEILSYRPFYIVGEVRTPGSYPYVAGMSVINGVALAGGFTYRAKKEDFYLTRTVGAKKERLDATAETPVEPGDVITVRERFF
jgi:protein involved in polysaccharide export with SLBB domain